MLLEWVQGCVLTLSDILAKSISSNFQTRKTMVVQSVHLKAPFFGYQSVLESNETQNLYSKLQVFEK